MCLPLLIFATVTTAASAAPEPLTLYDLTPALTFDAKDPAQVAAGFPTEENSAASAVRPTALETNFPIAGDPAGAGTSRSQDAVAMRGTSWIDWALYIGYRPSASSLSSPRRAKTTPFSKRNGGYFHLYVQMMMPLDCLMHGKPLA